MARGKQYGTYSLDNGTLFAMEVDDNRFADAAFGWTTPTAGTTLIPRGVKVRKVHGVSVTTGRSGSAVVPGTLSDVWTGVASTFDGYGNDGSLDTYSITSRVGETVRVSR
jgi:hypothetical protein